MKKIFNLLKEKFEKFSFKTFLVLFGSAFVVNLFSGFLGDVVLITSLIYLVTKGIVPKVKNIGSKVANFFKPKFNKLKEIKNGKKGKKFNLFKSKKKNIEEKEFEDVIEIGEDFDNIVDMEDTFEDVVENEENVEEIVKVKKEKKSIPNIIKNLKLSSTNKFNLNLEVKKDVNGCKIVNGSYRMVGKDIIDSKTNFIYPSQNQECSQKTYVKTK